ncbi:LSU ribosomal protein L22P [Roseimicrobium gellanilyticum]|jgi:large subunit ribosomal protein L22|uniref:Large ribosomal subunit protein uL22 n=1 Tax=Roseimicrobium gellanilyticum TaxID=748857 RepID=A0A366HUB9_9BACT|nr:50S ribosomal protein L22 [Roseimicrobium gellanilyticum]RBP47876.1 LSU ribosomal protein L22P [Roseimicrobium gellanilyticum]
MEVKSVTKFARISDLKAREVARAVQGMPVSQALSVLNFTPKKAALLIGKTLRSAIANAENNHELDADDLYIKSATATKGPVLKRIMPRARGSAAGIKKRMSHLTIVLAQKPEEKEEAKPKRAAKSKKAAEKA